jgi:hypothetical protein
MIPLTEDQVRVLAWAASRPDKRPSVLQQLADMKTALIRDDELMASHAKWAELRRVARAALEHNIRVYEAALAGGFEA